MAKTKLKWIGFFVCWFGFIRDEILPSYIGIINHEIRIPSLTHRLNFSWLMCYLHPLLDHFKQGVSLVSPSCYQRLGH